MNGQSLRRLAAMSFAASLSIAHDGRAAGVAEVLPHDQAGCLGAIRDAERNARLPPRLLDAIGLVESGRPDPQTGRVTPWPWTINVAGVGHFYESKSDAIAAVQAARAAGVQSIDVGCMQINLMYHPGAFASLEQAFDPRANAVYAAGFLTALYSQMGDWGSATGAYHSQTPALGDGYRQRVAASSPAALAIGIAPRNPRGLGGQPQIDPHGQLTPEFRNRLVQDAAADRAARVAMGLVPSRTVSGLQAIPTQFRLDAQNRNRRSSPAAQQASLSN